MKFNLYVTERNCRCESDWKYTIRMYVIIIMGLFAFSATSKEMDLLLTILILWWSGSSSNHSLMLKALSVIMVAWVKGDFHVIYFRATL